jgi:hypothetical protein
MAEYVALLLDLPAEMLVAIATHLDNDDEHRDGRAKGDGKLKWAASCKLKLSGKVVNRAAWLGQLELLRWMRALGCCAWESCKGDGKDPCASAAEGGHLAVLQWLRDNGCPWDVCTCSHAAMSGNLAVLQWARANGWLPVGLDVRMCR